MITQIKPTYIWYQSEPTAARLSFALAKFHFRPFTFAKLAARVPKRMAKKDLFFNVDKLARSTVADFIKLSEPKKCCTNCIFKLILHRTKVKLGIHQICWIYTGLINLRIYGLYGFWKLFKNESVSSANYQTFPFALKVKKTQIFCRANSLALLLFYLCQISSFFAHSNLTTNHLPIWFCQWFSDLAFCFSFKCT